MGYFGLSGNSPPFKHCNGNETEIMFTFSPTIFDSRTRTLQLNQHMKPFKSIFCRRRKSPIEWINRFFVDRWQQMKSISILRFLSMAHSIERTKGGAMRWEAGRKWPDYVFLLLYANETIVSYSFFFFHFSRYVLQIPVTNVIRTRFQPVKFIAKSSSINRKYGEDIKRIVSPCKHELKFTNDTKRSVKLYVSFCRCLRQTIRRVTFFFPSMRQTMVVRDAARSIA